MTDEDKARAAERLLAEPMLAEALALVEHDYIEAMLRADSDVALREGRDTVKAIRAIPVKLQHAIMKVQEAKRKRLGVV
jgi:3-polyprenyl-4-hydroxybenzoate decarboxylase